MNKLLRYSFIALLAMIGMNNALAEEVTIETNSTTFALTGEDYVANKDGVTFTYSKGTSTSDISGGVKDDQLRIYKNATFSISSAKTISKIVVTAVINNKIGAEGFVAEGYTAAEDQLSGTWAGSSNAVTLTASGGQVRITQVTVTLGDAPAVTVAAPTISGTTSFVGSTEVTITNNEEGAKVYYTTNGDDPTASSQEYAAPFRVTETTTVKAIAIKNGTSSTVASKTFTAVPSVANIAALNALQNNDVFAFTGEAVVVYVNGKYAYIKDDSGSSLVYDSGSSKLANLALGKKIAANWTGKVSIYKNLFEAVPDAVLAVTDAAAVEITYPEVEIADVVAANMNKVVVLKGVTYTALEGKNFMIDKGSSAVKGYNQFGLEIAAPEEGKTYDITGAISVYTEAVQFQPIAIVEATAAAADTWTVAGTLPLVNNEWDPTDTSADMTPNGNGEGVSSYEKDNIVLEKGTSYEFKVVKNHSWNEAYPAQNYSFTVDETGIYHVKIFFNTTTHEISVEKTKTGEAGPVTHTYSVIGNFKDDWKTDFDMTKGEDGLYKAVIEDVAKGEYKFKVRVDKAWTTSYPASDYQLTVDADNSTVTVTFNEETKEVNATVAAGAAGSGVAWDFTVLPTQKIDGTGNLATNAEGGVLPDDGGESWSIIYNVAGVEDGSELTAKAGEIFEPTKGIRFGALPNEKMVIYRNYNEANGGKYLFFNKAAEIMVPAKKGEIIEIVAATAKNNKKITSQDVVETFEDGEGVTVKGIIIDGTTKFVYNTYTLTVAVENPYLSLENNICIKSLAVKDASGINTLNANTKVYNGAIYNLAGQKVGADYKGLVIKNGRKYIQK